MKLALALCLLASIAGQPGPVATFESDLWPGERLSPERLEIGCRAALRAAPSDGADILSGATARRGDRLAFTQTRYVTIKPGAFQATSAAKLHGRVLGPVRHLSRDAYYSGAYPAEDVAVAAGAVVEYLQYRAEGTCFVRLNGVVIDADRCPLYTKGFELIKEPVVEQWALVTVAKVAGWIKVDDACVKVVADAAAAGRRLSAAGSPFDATPGAAGGHRIVVPPGQTHGLWLELRGTAMTDYREAGRTAPVIAVTMRAPARSAA